MEHRRGILFMLLLMFWSLGFLIVFSLVMSVLFTPFEGNLLYDFFYSRGIYSWPIVSLPWFMIFYQISVFLIPLALWLAIFKEKINKHLPHMRLGTTNVLYIVGISIFLQPVMMAISGLTTIFFPNEIGELMYEIIDYPYWLLIVAVAATPAICEEVVFRGYIQSTYKNKPFITMALINGLFFGIIHLNPHQFFFAFGMGIIFAYMVHATRSIRAGVISHFVMNASQITLLWISRPLLEWAEGMSEELGMSYAAEAAYEMEFTQSEVILGFIMLGIIAVFSTVVAGILLYFFAKHNRARVSDYEAKLEEETPQEIPNENLQKIPQPSKQGRKNLAIDTALVLAIVAMYVFIVFIIL